MIDYDKPASERYKEVFEHFKEPLLDMEDYWWNTFYSEELRQWYRDHMDDYKVSQPDAYGMSEALADFLGLEVAQTFGVSAVTAVSTYCTSIVARDLDGSIVHVRNLDFSYTEVMKQLVFDAITVKDGHAKVKAPSIAGFYGIYTGEKEGAFSISYNARERDAGATPEILKQNLQYSLDPARMTDGDLTL